MLVDRNKIEIKEEKEEEEKEFIPLYGDCYIESEVKQGSRMDVAAFSRSSWAKERKRRRRRKDAGGDPRDPRRARRLGRLRLEIDDPRVEARVEKMERHVPRDDDRPDRPPHEFREEGVHQGRESHGGRIAQELREEQGAEQAVQLLG